MHYKHKRGTRQFLFGAIVLFFFCVVFSLLLSSALQPSGGSTTPIKSESAASNAPQSAVAQAGNVTELNIFGYSITQSWHGYFGNVTGAIQLADSSNRVFYNWTLANPQGEVFASKNQSILWSNTQCFNFTARGNLSTGATGETAGATNLFGMNVTQLESEYSIAWDDVDGVNETFNLLGTGTHDLFFVANLGFSEGECRSTRIFSNVGAGETNKFEEVLLYEPITGSVIFSSLLEDNLLGFDDRSHDFEMLVLENGHGTDTSVTPYYFFVELE